MSFLIDPWLWSVKTLQRESTSVFLKVNSLQGNVVNTQIPKENSFSAQLSRSCISLLVQVEGGCNVVYEKSDLLVYNGGHK